MKITKQFLENNNACRAGFNWFANKYNTEPELQTVIDDLMSIDHFDWSVWLLTHIATPENRVRIAIFAAEKVLHVFEDNFPNDNRPRKAIQAAKEYLNTKNAVTYIYHFVARAAADAAYAARAVTNAARAVTNAAYAADAAYFVARAVTNAAYSVAYVARAVTRAAYAYGELASTELKIEIIEYAIELINEQVTP